MSSERIMIGTTEQPTLAETASHLSVPAFYMTAQQTQSGAVLTEHMASVVKQIAMAQEEFAAKLAAIASRELSAAKSVREKAEVYEPYWEQLQVALRLCQSWSASSKQ